MIMEFVRKITTRIYFFVMFIGMALLSLLSPAQSLRALMFLITTMQLANQKAKGENTK